MTECAVTVPVPQIPGLSSGLSRALAAAAARRRPGPAERWPRPGTVTGNLQHEPGITDDHAWQSVTAQDRAVPVTVRSA